MASNPPPTEASDIHVRYHALEAKYRFSELARAGLPGAMMCRFTSNPLLVLAPHSVSQMRADRRKSPEFWTGGLAELIAEVFACSVITSLGSRVEEIDAASRDPFGDLVVGSLQRLGVKQVIDIHGLSRAHGIDINVGTGAYPVTGPTSRFIELLRARFKVSVDTPFSGARGLTSLVREQVPHVSAVQLEVGPRLRSDTVSRDSLRYFLDCVKAAYIEERSSWPSS